LAAVALFAAAFVGRPRLGAALGVGGVGLLAGLALARALRVGARFGSDGVARLRARVVPDVWDLGYVCAAVASVWWLAARSGVPAFRHDWNYGATPDAFAREIWAQASPWQDAGLGHSLAQAGMYPAYSAIGALGYLLGPHVALLLAIGLLPLVAALAARRAFVALGGSSAVAAAPAALVYGFGPVTFNRIVSGHLMHLYFIATLPLVVWLAVSLSRCAFGRRSLGLALLLGLLVASEGHQVHALGIALLVALVVLGLRGRFVEGAIVACVAVLLQAPTLAALWSAPGDVYSLKRPVLAWEAAQSAPPQLLAWLAGSLARYDVSATPAASVAALAGVVALAPLGVLRLSRSACWLVVVGVCFAFVAMGLDGPFAALLTWGFTHVSAFAAIRELYDVVPPFAFAACCAAAAALDVALTSCAVWFGALGAGLAAGACGLASVLGCVPVLGGFASSFVPVPAIASASASALAALPGDARILLIPGMYPSADASGAGAGYDPLEHTAGAHAVVSAMQPSSAVASAYLGLADGRPDEAAWLRGLGIGFVAVDREARRAAEAATELPSAAALEYGAARLAVGAPLHGPGVDVYRLSDPGPPVQAVSVALGAGPPRGARDPSSVTLLVDDPVNAGAYSTLTGRRVSWSRVAPSDVTADPSLAPVLGRNVWERVPQVGDLPGDAAVAGVGLTLPVAPGVAAMAYDRAAGAPVRTACCLRFPGAFALLGTHSALHYAPGVVARSAGSLAVARVDATTYDLVQRGSVAAAVVLRSTFDPGWRLVRADSGAALDALHFRADGWANGWLVRLRPGERARITYWPAAFVRAFSIAATCGWVAVALAAIGLLALPGAASRARVRPAGR
jgi:hypothetical protein